MLLYNNKLVLKIIMQTRNSLKAATNISLVNFGTVKG